MIKQLIREYEYSKKLFDQKKKKKEYSKKLEIPKHHTKKNEILLS